MNNITLSGQSQILNSQNSDMFLHLTVWLICIFFFTKVLNNGNLNDSSVNRIPLVSFAIFVLKCICNFGQRESLSQMLSRYGSIVSCGFHSSPIVVISNNLEAVKKILNSPNWNGRPKSKVSSARNYGEQNLGVLLSSGQGWKETRKCVVKTLTQLGFDNNTLVKTANEELNYFLEMAETAITETENKVQAKHLFSLSTLNIVWRIAGGHRFRKDDPVFTNLLDATDIISDYSIHKYILFELFYPVIKILHFIFKNSNVLGSMDDVKGHITDMVAEHKNLLSEGHGNFKHNLTDAFLTEMQQGKSNQEQIFNYKNLIVILTDLFEAGADTTSSTLEFALAFLVNRPEVQVQMQNEIQSVIGENEPNYFAHKIFMPYTQAVIYEIHRMACVSPFVFRSADCDTNINETYFPKGTAAFVNLYSIHYNKALWGDPQNFRPERFLDPNGLLENYEIRKVLAFGAGRRVCIGEKVSNTLIFTFLVGILRKYNIKKAFPNEELGPNHNSGVTAHIKPFHISFTAI